jgi:hypothetical protein
MQGTHFNQKQQISHTYIEIIVQFRFGGRTGLSHHTALAAVAPAGRILSFLTCAYSIVPIVQH